MRVLQVGKYFYPDAGGIETVTESISEAIVAAGHVCDVLCFGLAGDYAPLERSYRVERARPTFRAGNKVFSVDFHRRLAELEPHYDVAIVHMPNPAAGLAMLLHWRKAIILLWHADVQEAWARAISGVIDRPLIAAADLIVSPTPMHSHESHWRERLMPKVRIAPYPFDARRLGSVAPTPMPAEIAEFLNGRSLVLSVGRLVPYKGFSIFVEAAEQLAPHSAVVIVGTGPMEGELRSQIEAAGLESRVMLAGRLGDGELAALYAAATVFCLPSVTAAEMYGMVQLEAMAVGTPVVSTRIPRSGAAWVNEHGRSGLVVEAGSPSKLAAALNGILNNPERRQELSAGAVSLFREKHDFEIAGARYIEIAREAIDIHRQRTASAKRLSARGT